MSRTEGQWIKGIGFISPNENIPILLRNSYLNFGGSVIGDAGYGFRDNGGIMQYKNLSGAWTDFSAGGGSGMFVEIPTGTVNSSNLNFTVTVVPKFIITDTGIYIENFGYTRSGFNITMDLFPNTFIRAYS